MKYFLAKIILRYLAFNGLSWSFLLAYDLISSNYFGDDVGISSSFFGLIAPVFFSVSIMNGTRWPLIWRRTSENIKQFWIGISAVLIFNMACNWLFYFFVSSALFPKGAYSLASLSTKIDSIWMLIILYLVSLVLLFDNKALTINTSLKPIRQLFRFLGIYALIIVLVALGAYSRLIGYFAGTVFLASLFLFRNSFVLSSLQFKTRLQALTLSIVGITILAGLSYGVAISNPPGSFTLLGLAGPQKAWKYSDLEKIDKTSSLINWLQDSISAKHKLSEEEKVAVLTKLETLCPATSTDSPAIIECHEKDAQYDSIAMSVHSDEKIILQNLDSKNIYLRLYGILAAREMDALPAGIKGAIEKISATPSRLSVVAENSLAWHGQKQVVLNVILRKDSKK